MQGSSYAPLQFLRSPWNRDVYTAIDNQVDGRTVLVLYLGAASTLPSELQKYNIGCILLHKDEKQIYLNTGNDTTPTWEAFGPGTSALPTPFVSGQYLTNDGVDAFWSLIDLATGVDGLLDSDHIDIEDLANNNDFIDFLIANSYFTTSLANDSNFLTNLITNLNTGGLLAVVTDGVTITGDGTTLDPLVAVGNGALPLDVQLNGASVENPVGTINFIAPSGTVTSPSTGVVDVDLNSIINATSGTELWLGNGFTGANQYNNAMVFGDYIISAFRTNSNTFSTLTQKKNSAGGYEVVSDFAYWSNDGSGTALSGITKSSDGTKIYMMTITGSNFNPWTFVLKEYDLTATLLNTYTYVSPSGFLVRPECLGLTVIGSQVIVSAQYEPTFTGVGFWTEFTMSGSALVSPTITNLGISGTGIYSTVYDGSNVYIGYGIITSGPFSNSITKYTYSSPTFTTVTTRSLPSVPVTTASPQHQFLNGFEIDGLNIGFYKNTSTFDIDQTAATVNTILKAKYDLYTF